MGAIQGASLLHAAQAGDLSRFAKFLSWLEASSLSEVLALKEFWNPKKATFRFGITGPPGAGKSTLVSRLLTQLRLKNLRVGVLAVDPSSPFTQGAILGDRIRYSEHFLDSNVFIRSLGTRGSLGGLSRSAFLMARAFDLCGFDILLIETVGVGQTELDILHVADEICVVLVPESGDSIQAMKAGLMEIADVFVVNKADRPGADSLLREIQNSLHDGAPSTEKDPVEVFKCIASENVGVDEVARHLLQKSLLKTWPTHRTKPEHLQAEAKSLLRAEWERNILKSLSTIQDVASFKKVFLHGSTRPKAFAKNKK
jgi:LAO/AO transport system kinase